MHVLIHEHLATTGATGAKVETGSALIVVERRKNFGISLSRTDELIWFNFSPSSFDLPKPVRFDKMASAIQSADRNANQYPKAVRCCSITSW